MAEAQKPLETVSKNEVALRDAIMKTYGLPKARAQEAVNLAKGIVSGKVKSVTLNDPLYAPVKAVSDTWKANKDWPRDIAKLNTAQMAELTTLRKAGEPPAVKSAPKMQPMYYATRVTSSDGTAFRVACKDKEVPSETYSKVANFVNSENVRVQKLVGGEWKDSSASEMFRTVNNLMANGESIKVTKMQKTTL